MTYMMLDRDVVAVSPSSTCRVLKEAPLESHAVEKGSVTKGGILMCPT